MHCTACARYYRLLGKVLDTASWIPQLTPLRWYSEASSSKELVASISLPTCISGKRFGLCAHSPAQTSADGADGHLSHTQSLLP